MSDYKTQKLYFKKLEDNAKRFAQIGMATNSTSMTRKASVLCNRIEREKAKINFKCPQKNKKIRMNFEELKKSSRRVIELKNLSVYASEKKIVDNVSFSIMCGERIAIVGNNGSGKSTIIKTIIGKQTLPWSGEVNISSSIKIGYLPQIINFENNKQNVLEYFQYNIGKNEQQSRSILSGFKFDNESVTKTIENLSGGEKIKLKLAILLQKKVNCLIFDEPTNHIDIPTRESLENAIDDFSGTLLFVSHDRFFINKFAEKVIEICKQKANVYYGNYEDYTQVRKSQFE
jgi:ATPase subunit of ABC transporter with duplicated ATPase domains